MCSHAHDLRVMSPHSRVYLSLQLCDRQFLLLIDLVYGGSHHGVDNGAIWIHESVVHFNTDRDDVSDPDSCGRLLAEDSRIVWPCECWSGNGRR